MMAKRLQEIDPEHSRRNMKKAHLTMKKRGTFVKHQKEAAAICMKKNPNQLNEMSKKAHEMYPLGLLALESSRRNHPYEFMGCFFDSDSERKVCKKFVNHQLIDRPIEGKNIHFRINKKHIDFFIQNRVFVEFHPSVKYQNSKLESTDCYYTRRRNLLNKNGFEKYPLIVIETLRTIESDIKKIKKLVSSI